MRQTTMMGYFSEAKCSRKKVQTKVSQYFPAKDLSGYEVRVSKPKKIKKMRQVSLNEYVWDSNVLSFLKF